jgi:YVTN family beta-propeller protein
MIYGMMRLRSLLLISFCFLIGCKHGESGKTTSEPSKHYVVKKSAEGNSVVDLYASTRAGDLSAAAKAARPLVYVPNSKSNTVTVIDPVSRKVLRTFKTGKLPQHVVPSYDMSTLWVTNNEGNSLKRIDPQTGMDSDYVRVDDPYNLYFTPDGKNALVIAERLHRIDFRDPKNFNLIASLKLKCRGPDHMDFMANDRNAIITCEFSGDLVKIDLVKREAVGYLRLQGHAMPQDIRSAPDGRTFFVADMKRDGIHVIDAEKFHQIGFIKTGKGTHGIVVGRGGRPFFILNRGSNMIGGGRHGPGTITVIDPESREILTSWPIPGGGSPDMGNITADGKELWVSGRYDSEVYDVNSTTGKLIARIPVGAEPHGVCVWPQPGRFSTGHTGNMR